MKPVILSAVFILCMTTGFAQAGERREIELKDGSVITGEIVSMSAGVYTVRTGSLGTVSIDESKIQAIRSPGAAQNSPQNSLAAGQAKSLQERMMSDQEIMGMIQSLKDDEGFQRVLQDPELMKAVEAGDIAALMANPKFMNLLNNRTVQDIQRKAADK